MLELHFLKNLHEHTLLNCNIFLVFTSRSLPRQKTYEVRSFLLILATCPAWALYQVPDSLKRHADSLETVLPTQQGKQRIETLIALAEYYRLTDARHAIKLLHEGLSLSQTAGNTKAMNLHNQLGVCYTIAGQYDSADYHLKRALALAGKNEVNLARIYSNQAILHTYSEEFEKSLGLYFKSLDIHNRRGNTTGQMSTYINIATLYASLRQYNKSLTYDLPGLCHRQKAR